MRWLKFRDWLISNGGLKSSQNAVGIPWNVLFSFALWWIWKQRNQVVFNSKSVNPNLSKSISSQALEFFLCASKPSLNRPMIIKQVKWERLERGWLKLNTDGSWNATLGKAAGGGLIRDDMGNWVIGFSRQLGNVNTFAAEIWVLQDGLMLIHQMKLPAIIIELDAKALVDALKNPRYGNSVISPLFDDWKVLISQIPHVRINHVFREANKCADRLANSGHSQASEFCIYSVPPVDLVSFVEADFHGESCSRRCPGLVSSC